MLDASLCVSVLVLNGHFYYHAYINRNFTSAVTIASNQVISGLTAHLITVTSFVEFIFVASCLGTSWLGMSDSTKEGNWTIVTGPEVGLVAPYLIWSKGEPNGSTTENCMDYGYGGFRDVSCSLNRTVAVEFECNVTYPATDMSSCSCTFLKAR